MSLIIDPSLFYNPNAPCTLKEAYLPLLDQQGKLQFVTFRCFDSIPAKQREELKELKLSFEKTHSKPWDKKTLISYRKLIGAREEQLLDAGYGRCLLKYTGYRQIVEDSLLYFNEIRYDLHSYVIMPNHVHILLVMLGENKIEDALESMKRFSARLINEKAALHGKYWDGQNYCRLIRNQNHYDIVRSYINSNPRFLKEGEYTLKNFK